MDAGKQITDVVLRNMLNVPELTDISEAHIPQLLESWNLIDEDTKKALISTVPKTVEAMLAQIAEGNRLLGESHNKIMDFYDKAIGVIQDLLRKENRTFDEEKFLIEQLNKILGQAQDATDKNRKDIIDNQDKSYQTLYKVLGIIGAILGVAVLAFLFGGSSKEDKITDSNDDIPDVSLDFDIDDIL